MSGEIAPIPETSRRRDAFAEGLDVTLADGATWWLPMAGPTIVAAAGTGGRAVVELRVNGRVVAGLLDAYTSWVDRLWACDRLPEDAAAEQWVTTHALADAAGFDYRYRLVLENYDLTPREAAALVRAPIDPDALADFEGRFLATVDLREVQAMSDRARALN